MDLVQEMALTPSRLNNTSDHEHSSRPVQVVIPTYRSHGAKEFIKKELAKLHLQEYIKAVQEEE